MTPGGNSLLTDINEPTNTSTMRKADVVSGISEKTGIPKVDILVALEAFFKEVKTSLIEGEPVYVRGFGSFVLKKRATKIMKLWRYQSISFLPLNRPKNSSWQ